MVNTSRLLKFHGKFRDLIPNGFTFQKLFAANYRQYHYEQEAYSSDDVRVWQHHGGYVEFSDWLSFSKQVVNALYDKDFKWKVREFDGARVCVANLQTGYIEQYYKPIHDPMCLHFKMEENGMGEHEMREAYKAFSRTYREIVVTPRMLREIRKLVNKGWIIPDTNTVTPLVLSAEESILEMIARKKVGGTLVLNIE